MAENKRRRPRGQARTHVPVDPPIGFNPTADVGLDAPVDPVTGVNPAVEAELDALTSSHHEPAMNILDALNRENAKRCFTLEFALETNIRRVLLRPFSVSMLKELEETARLSRQLMQTAQRHKEST
jgi:hypothetical protein